MADEIKQRLQNDLKTAMKGRDTKKVDTIRFALAAIKQQEIDKRITLKDSEILAVIEKLIKQYRDSISQYKQAGRTDLAEKENAELDILQEYMPTPLSDAEIDQLIKQAIDESGATSPRDMGRVIQIIKNKAPGRVDISALSVKIKQILSN